MNAEGWWLSTGHKWHTHRKMITPTFHFKILEAFHEVFVEKCEILARKMARVADGTTEFDVYPFITHCTLDIICGECAPARTMCAIQREPRSLPSAAPCARRDRNGRQAERAGQHRQEERLRRRHLRVSLRQDT